MRKTWTYVIVGVLVFILALAIAIPFFTGGLDAYNSYGYYHGWMMGPYMMGGYGYGAYGWIGMMVFMLLIFLGAITLVAGEATWLARAIGGSNSPAITTRTCSSCGRSIRIDWSHCPYCGAQQR